MEDTHLRRQVSRAAITIKHGGVTKGELRDTLAPLCYYVRGRRRRRASASVHPVVDQHHETPHSVVAPQHSETASHHSAVHFTVTKPDENDIVRKGIYYYARPDEVLMTHPSHIHQHTEHFADRIPAYTHVVPDYYEGVDEEDDFYQA